MKIRTSVVAATLLLVGLATTACEDKAAAPGSATEAANGAAEAADGADSADSAPTEGQEEPAANAGDTGLPPGAPDDFPVPPGAEVRVATDKSFVVVGDDVQTVVEYYRKALPEAGYEIVSDVETAGVVSLSFTGNGVQGTIAVAGNTVAVSLA